MTPGEAACIPDTERKLDMATVTITKTQKSLITLRPLYFLAFGTLCCASTVTASYRYCMACLLTALMLMLCETCRHSLVLYFTVSITVQLHQCTLLSVLRLSFVPKHGGSQTQSFFTKLLVSSQARRFRKSSISPGKPGSSNHSRNNGRKLG